MWTSKDLKYWEQESTYDYVQGGLQANGEDAVKKNNPLFYYLNFASASAGRWLRPKLQP